MKRILIVDNIYSLYIRLIVSISFFTGSSEINSRKDKKELEQAKPLETSQLVGLAPDGTAKAFPKTFPF